MRQVAVRTVDVDDVEAGVGGAEGRLHVRALHAADAGEVELDRVGEHVGVVRDVLAPTGWRRVGLSSRAEPACHSSMPASAPCACMVAAVAARLAASSSSQRRTGCGTGFRSDAGSIEVISTFTAAQPPSAFMARNAAWEAGRSEPKPDECRTA